MRVEEAVYIHRIRQHQNEELVIVSVGDVQFGALVPKEALRTHAIKIIEDALAWAKENCK